ncbi:hypothetical protein ACIQWR_33870 [Streptomyces sp. NPDC098789]|uniref:hypothetical protein n=1 Tax=Streptomyces sp. NPDC098789 TaxID=3366098 RepID=UPI003828B9DA
MRPRWSALAATALLAALGALAGCSQGTGYAVPDAACGVGVGAAALKPLLPAGDTLRLQPEDLGQGSARCTLSVDAKPALSLKTDVSTEVADLPKVIQEKLDRSGHPEKIALPGGEGWVADSLALATVKCTFQGQPRLFITEVAAHGGPSDVAKRRSALTALITAYEPAARKAAGCTPGPS